MTREYELVDGVAYISRKNLAELFNVTRQQIIKYEKPQNYPTPLQKADFKKGVEVYYNLFEAVKWHTTYITTNKEVKSVVEETFSDNLNVSEDELKEVTLDNMKITMPLDSAKRERAERLKKEYEAKLAKFKVRLEEGRLIYKEDCDEGKIIFLKSMLSTLKKIQDKTPNIIIDAIPDDVDVDSRSIQLNINEYIEEELKRMSDELKKQKAKNVK
jgi:hypothetical protein